MKDSVPRIHPEYKPPEIIPRPPAQLNLFTGKPEPVVVSIDDYWGDREIRVEEGITLSKSGDSSPIILSSFGLFLGRKSERLVVKSQKKVIYEFPFFSLNEVAQRVPKKRELKVLIENLQKEEKQRFREILRVWVSWC